MSKRNKKLEKYSLFKEKFELRIWHVALGFHAFFNIILILVLLISNVKISDWARIIIPWQLVFGFFITMAFSNLKEDE